MVAEDGQQKEDVGGQHQTHVEHLHKKVLEGCCYMTVDLGHFFPGIAQNLYKTAGLFMPFQF
jgi:hypothetical protein